MRPIEFKEMNAVFGAWQKEYEPLPAHLTESGEVVSCWELTPEDIERVKKTGCVWLSQLTFKDPLQPVCITADYPFIGNESR